MDIFKRKVVIIVQARMGATRLPGKPLRKVLDKTLLSYQLERLRSVKNAQQIVVATTLNLQDNPIEALCVQEKVAVYRGSEQDVLDRFYKAAKSYSADIVVRICGDCPLIDPEVIDQVICFYLEHQYDYVANTLKRTYPRGLDVEVFSFKMLEKIAFEAVRPEEREHVTPFFYEHSERFKLGNVACSIDESRHRWTVDTEEDFLLISKILTALYPAKKDFRCQDVLSLLQTHPEWALINAHIKQKTIR